jgi:hypothetical protein
MATAIQLIPTICTACCVGSTDRGFVFLIMPRYLYNIQLKLYIFRRNALVDGTEIARQTQILSQRLSIAQEYL